MFLSSSNGIDERYFALAREVGRTLAEAGIEVVSGGGAIAAMGELARSTRAAGGRTVGVIPARLMDWEVGDTDADELVVTSDMRERKAQMDQRSDAFLALPGGLGTLEELLEAWVGRNLGMHRKPVVVLDPWGDFADLRRAVDGLVNRGFVRQEAASDVVWTETVEHAVNAITARWASGEGRNAPHVETNAPEWLEAD